MREISLLRAIGYSKVSLRHGPADQEPSRLTLEQGAHVTILDSESYSDWVKVATARGTEGWVKAIELGAVINDFSTPSAGTQAGGAGVKSELPAPARQVPAGYKLCPACAEEVRVEAVKCRFCGVDLNAALAASLSNVPLSPRRQQATEAPHPDRSVGSEPRRSANYDDDRRRAAAGRSYTTPAVFTLVLYFVLWIPGLIANFAYLGAASRDQRLTGQSPEGKGCLVALLWIFVILPVVGGVVIGIIFVSQAGK